MIKFIWEVLKSMGGWTPPNPDEKPPLGMEATDLNLVKKTNNDNAWRQGINDSHKRDM
jgi:hypothetical protein